MVIDVRPGLGGAVLPGGTIPDKAPEGGSPTWYSYDSPILFDESKWSGDAAFYHQAYMNAVVGILYSRIYDVTASAAVTDSLIQISGATRTLVRSSEITLTDGHVYKVQFGVAAGDSGQASKAEVWYTN